MLNEMFSFTININTIMLICGGLFSTFRMADNFSRFVTFWIPSLTGQIKKLYGPTKEKQLVEGSCGVVKTRRIFPKWKVKSQIYIRFIKRGRMFLITFPGSNVRGKILRYWCLNKHFYVKLFDNFLCQGLSFLHTWCLLVNCWHEKPLTRSITSVCAINGLPARTQLPQPKNTPSTCPCSHVLGQLAKTTFFAQGLQDLVLLAQQHQL